MKRKFKALLLIILLGLVLYLYTSFWTDFKSYWENPQIWQKVWIAFSFIFLVFLGFVLLVLLFKQIRQSIVDFRMRAVNISKIDLMTGEEFEDYITNLLRFLGYKVKNTKLSHDLGVDVIAISGEIKYAIQCKRYEDPISRRAVSDAVAGMQYYQCNRPMVVTNNYFTPGAKALAAATNCVLIDRNKLTDWIVEYQSR